MIRRITAGAAGLALAGTAFAAPAMAASNTTVLTLDAGLVSVATGAGVVPSAVKPGKLSGTKLSMPAKLKGTTVTHKGGLKLTLGGSFVTVQDIKLNTKNGKATAGVNNSLTNGVITIKNIRVVKGGKNTKKNGKWKGATVSLAKSVTIDNPPLGAQDPAALLAQVLGLPAGSIPTGQVLGKATVTVK
jgi:hypothetical protein